MLFHLLEDILHNFETKMKVLKLSGTLHSIKDTLIEDSINQDYLVEGGEVFFESLFISEKLLDQERC